MNQQTRLVWRWHRLVNPEAFALRRAVRNLSVPPGAAPGDGIWLPELPESPQAKAATLLQVAAQIEHGLMVQYLYAANSVDPGQNKSAETAQSTITEIAIEEMSHLMTVQNLLRCIGEKPYLVRQDDSTPVPDDQRLYPFDFKLEPLTDVSLAKYVVAESPDPDQFPPDTKTVMEQITGLANTARGEPVNRVAHLYLLIAAVLASEELLAELVKDTGVLGGFFLMVRDVAAEAACFYHGRDKLHLPDTAFDLTTKQATDPEWDRRDPDKLDEFRVHVIDSRRNALIAVADIGLQGEGPSSEPGELSHFRRFYDLFVELYVDGPGPTVKDVPSGTAILVDPNGSDDNVISDPRTVRWAQLADRRYAILLGSLSLYLQTTVDQDRVLLRGWCFAEMFAIKTLAGFLRDMPRSEGDPLRVAAFPFNPPPWLDAGAQWSDLEAAFEKSQEKVREAATDFDDGTDQHRLLVHLLASDERKRLESAARTGGTSVRTRTDEVRDILDWAAGTGNPIAVHFGGSPPLPSQAQGRFWNLQRDDFVQVRMNTIDPDAPSVTTPPPSGGDALLVKVLRTGFMPAGRPKLVGSPEFDVVEKWVRESCPDATLDTQGGTA